MSLSVKPRTTAPRPELPFAYANPHIRAYDPTKQALVKYQVITREGHDIIVGRIKVATPEGHAFVLRRFDTNAVSLTTMYRAAFPGAPDESEKLECAWVKANYDIAAANGGIGDNAAKLRLAGTWVTPEVAMAVGDAYAVGPILQSLTSAVPEAGTDYRKSTKLGGQTSSPVVTSPAAKRSRRDPSPAPSSPASPPLRRSTRQKSPAPKAVLASATAKPKSKKQQVISTVTSEENEDDAADVPGPDMETDLAEQKALIEKLKAEKFAAGTAASREKRKTAEEPPLTLNLDREPEIGERAIATNRRIQMIEMTPQRKSVAWGAGLFSAGLGAFYVATQYFPQIAQSLASL